MLTPYQFASNTPIAGIDVDGLEFLYTADGKLLTKIGKDTEIRVVTDNELVIWTKEYLKGNKKGKWDKDVMEHYIANGPGSTPFSKSPKEAQKNVASSIYKDIRSPHAVKQMDIEGANNGTVAHNFGVGRFGIFPNMTAGKEYLNDDYYNQLLTWVHEEGHNQSRAEGGSGKGDAFNHFLIHKKVVKHPLFSKTTEGYKKYSKDALQGYLREQRSYLTGEIHFDPENAEKTFTSKRFQKLYKHYNANKKWYKKQYGVDFEKDDSVRKVYELKKKKKDG